MRGADVIRVVIAEDNPDYTRQLHKYLQKYEQETGETCQITCFQDGLSLIEQYSPTWDILLLDIEMPRLDGMSAARHIRKIDSSVIIIFITNMGKYAIKGWEVGAMDFVLKPISYFAFATKMTKAVSVIHERKQASLVIPDRDGMQKILSDEIYYIEIMDHWLHIHTEHGVYSMLGTLRDMETRLAEYHFARCSKCYLVNLRHIVRLHGFTVTLTDGQTLQISRQKKKEFQLAVMNYYGGGSI